MLTTNFSKEVKTGFQFPFKIEDAIERKGSEDSLVVAATQDAIDDLGHIVEKYRPVDDQSFDSSPGHSVNNRFIVDNLPPLYH